MSGTAPALLAVSADRVTGALILGTIQGAIYGLVGLGLVLLYKSNRIFNFAQGEFGTVAALTTFCASTGALFWPKIPYGFALLIGLVAGTGTALVTERLVVRPLLRRPKITLVVATVGVTLFLIAVELFVLGPNILVQQTSLKKKAFEISGTIITQQALLILAVLAVLAVLSYLFFTKTSYGVAILAVSQEPTAASVVGINVNQISALTWGLAGLIGSVAGIILAPISIISPGFMTVVVLIPGFTAAVIGGITSLPGAFLGGILVGVAEQLFGLIPSSAVPGAARVGVALTLLVILLIRPSGILGKEA